MSFLGGGGVGEEDGDFTEQLDVVDFGDVVRRCMIVAIGLLGMRD